MQTKYTKFLKFKKVIPVRNTRNLELISTEEVRLGGKLHTINRYVNPEGKEIKDWIVWEGCPDCVFGMKALRERTTDWIAQNMGLTQEMEIQATPHCWLGNGARQVPDLFDGEEEEEQDRFLTRGSQRLEISEPRGQAKKEVPEGQNGVGAFAGFGSSMPSSDEGVTYSPSFHTPGDCDHCTIGCDDLPENCPLEQEVRYLESGFPAKGYGEDGLYTQEKQSVQRKSVKYKPTYPKGFTYSPSSKRLVCQDYTRMIWVKQWVRFKIAVNRPEKLLLAAERLLSQQKFGWTRNLMRNLQFSGYNQEARKVEGYLRKALEITGEKTKA